MKTRKPKGNGIDYWVINPTGNYGTDCDTGTRLAKEYLTYIGEHPTWFNASLLTSIVHEMVDRATAGQKWSGVQINDIGHVTLLPLSRRRS